MYWLLSRYYDPEVGRFINQDKYLSTGQGILGYNMYAYCRNNPINRKDVDGDADMDIFDSDTRDDLFPGTDGGIGHHRVDGPQGTTSSGQYSISVNSGINNSSVSTNPTAVNATNAVITSGNSYGIDVGNLNFSNTVNNHAGRPYQNSLLLINEIIQSKPPVPDPQGTGALSWTVGGMFNGSMGTFELVIDQLLNTVWHFVFKSKK